MRNKPTIGLDDHDSLTAMRKRQAAIGLRMQRIALIALAELEQKVARGEPLRMTAKDAQSMLDIGLRLEREGLGNPKKKPN